MINKLDLQIDLYNLVSDALWKDREFASLDNAERRRIIEDFVASFLDALENWKVAQSSELEEQKQAALKLVNAIEQRYWKQLNGETRAG